MIDHTPQPHPPTAGTLTTTHRLSHAIASLHLFSLSYGIFYTLIPLVYMCSVLYHQLYIMLVMSVLCTVKECVKL